MKPWPVLLRVVLVLSLLLNGLGSAMASAKMTMPAMPATAQERVATAPAASCHDMAAMDRAAAAAPEQAPQGKHPQPDCCKSGLCQCVCAHAAQFASPAMPALGFDGMRARLAQPMRSSHADPALPHLIRPPIG